MTEPQHMTAMAQPVGSLPQLKRIERERYAGTRFHLRRSGVTDDRLDAVSRAGRIKRGWQIVSFESMGDHLGAQCL